MEKAIEYINGKSIAITKGPMDSDNSERAERKDPNGNQIDLRQCEWDRKGVLIIPSL